MRNKVIRKLFTIVLSFAVMLSMMAGSLCMTYALDETTGQQIEGTVTGSESRSEMTQGDAVEGGESSQQEDMTPSDEADSGSENNPDNVEGEVTDPLEGTEEGATVETSENPEEPEEPEEPELVFPTYSSKSITARDMGINLRTMIGEPNAGYAVAQGAATDGTYAYFLMVCSANQKGRVVKTTLDGQLVKEGPVINTHHGNGMTYNSKLNQLVAVGYDEWRHQLSFIDPESLKLINQKNVSYPYKDIDGLSSKAYDNGLGGIAYVEKYDVYLARSRGYSSNVKSGTDSTIHNIWVLNSDLEAIAHIETKVVKQYPNVWQSMDADEKYVYYLLSPGSGQPNNIVLCLDWNSENLEALLNNESNVRKWKCNDNGSGEPDAVMKLSISKESEGLFHTRSVDENGNVSNHFYVSEYKGVQKYKTVTKKEAYKVKWKKVKKKVKWKKVKIKKGKNKGKYKWKYKTKKVWKYKTKYRTYTEKVKDYKARDDYFYDLGVF